VLGVLGGLGGGWGGVNRLSACASNPCFLCVSAALYLRERSARVGASPPLSRNLPGLRGRGDAAKGPVPPC
jgi:hypothetical protein